MKKLLLVFVGVLCLLSACQKGPNPKESLVAAGNALHNCDADNIEKYIDLTDLISNIIDYIATKDIAGVEKEQLMELSAAKMIIVPLAKQYILSGIRTLNKSEEYKGYMDLIKVKKYDILSNKDGIATAKIALDLEEAKKYADEKGLINEDIRPFMDIKIPDLVLKMKLDGDHWKIVDITNLDEITSVYEQVYKQYEAKQKEEESMREPLMMMGTISAAQQRHYLAKDAFTNNFENLDLDFQDRSGNMAKGSSFTTENGTTYTIYEEKVTARVSKPKEFYLERYYMDGKTNCRDNDNGMCKKLGL